MKRYERVFRLMDIIINDRTVPRNIRGAVKQAKEHLEGEGEEVVKISTAIHTLDEIINDPNMPLYTRTQIWNVVGLLEEIRRELEK